MATIRIVFPQEVTERKQLKEVLVRILFLFFILGSILFTVCFLLFIYDIRLK
jgi:hypothetical protein